MNVRRLIVTVGAGLALAAPLAPSALAASPNIPSGSAGTGSSSIDDLIGAFGSSSLTQTGSVGGPVYKNCDDVRRPVRRRCSGANPAMRRTSTPTTPEWLAPRINPARKIQHPVWHCATPGVVFSGRCFRGRCFPLGGIAPCQRRKIPVQRQADDDCARTDEAVLHLGLVELREHRMLGLVRRSAEDRPEPRARRVYSRAGYARLRSPARCSRYPSPRSIS